MAKEIAEFLNIRKAGLYIDGTAGSGGHTKEVLRHLGPQGRVLAIDRDRDAINRIAHLAKEDKRLDTAHENYADMCEVADTHDINSADGIVLDLGISSEQLQTDHRGFSFERDGPLDMRMDQESGLTAMDIVNTYSEQALSMLIREWGEEPAARRIARAIVRARSQQEIATTTQLAKIVSDAVGGRRGRQHPATRTFQALRIVVNKEIDYVERGLEAGIELLNEGGRIAVVSFHSIEDRAVKRCFKVHEGRLVSLPEGGEAWEGKPPALSIVTKRPITPSEEERERNPRSRSAKLRVAERIAEREEGKIRS